MLNKPELMISKLSDFVVEGYEEGEEKKSIGIFSIFKYGTESSGNYGHAGRPGEVGGSAPGGGSLEEKYERLDARAAARIGLELTKLNSKGERVFANGKKLPEYIKTSLDRGPIPPKWTNVYVNPSEKSAISGKYAVRGRDENGDTQGLYHKLASSARSEAKFEKVRELEEKLNKMEKENNKNLSNKEKETVESAAVLRLIIATAIRPGKETEKAVGATTLKGQHVVKTAYGANLQFVAKSGVSQNIKVTDNAVARDLLSRAKSSGKDGRLFDTNYMKLWKYTKSLGSGGYTSKDFRTLTGTRAAIDRMKTMKPPTSEKEYKRAVLDVAKHVSSKLGNTPKVALKHYIDPHVFSEWRIK